jgi:DNA-directed RNA polymerase subunit RPC12/RpoP
MSTQLKACAAGFVCLLCGKTIKRKDNAKVHIAEKHMPPRQYRCPPCGRQFTNRGFSGHVNNVHPTWKGIDYENFLVLD